MEHISCGFIGLGLIGGSIARALKEKVKNVTIIAYDISEQTLQAAYEDGIADRICTEIGEQFGGCDYIFLCAEVQNNCKNLDSLKQYITSHCILTDVGSVKTNIHEYIEGTQLASQFIGGHPMAGSERTGYVNSKAQLLENAYYILTPAKGVSQEKVEAFRKLVTDMGAIPLILTCEEHDYVTAAVSHLPHVIAASLVNLVRDSDSKEGIMKMIAAGGFKDITRIASSSAAMWQQICLTNHQNILSLLDDYMAALSRIRESLQQQKSDELYELFDSARVYRDSFVGSASGPIKISYSITVDISDEPGALAAIATLLALQQISIKNMGIVHNRESQDGVLSVEFNDENDMNRAKQVLTTRGYHIYDKKS